MKIIHVVHRYTLMHGDHGDMTVTGILGPTLGYTIAIACLMQSTEVMVTELSKPDKPAMPVPAMDDY